MNRFESTTQAVAVLFTACFCLMEKVRMVVALVLATVVCADLSAQELEPNDTLDTVYLKEIIVTATRGSGEMLAVPMAVGVIDAKEFSRSRNMGLAEALWSMPGVLAQSRAGGQDVRLTIRGFGSRGNGDRSNAATIRGIKVLIDGIPETEPDGRTSLDLVDLTSIDRIEVVRSNASTLFGNASGGVINVETVSWFQHPFVESKNIFGSFGLRRNNISVGVPISWGWSSVKVTRSVFGGWRQHSASSSTNARAAVVVEFKESDRLKLIAAAAETRFNIPGPITLLQYQTDPAAVNPVYLARRERRHNQVGRISFQLQKALADGHDVEITGYVGPKVLQRSERNTFRDFNRFHLGGGAVYHWRQKNSLLSQLTVGADGAYQDGSILFYTLVNGARGDSLRTNKREAAGTFGVFAQAELTVIEQGTLVAGARYDHQRYTSEMLPAGKRLSRPRETLTFRHLSPRVAFNYRLDKFHSVYVNAGGGLEVPAFNEVDPPPSLPGVELNPFLKPMTSTTIETGIKGIESFSGGKFLRSLSYSLAAYMISIRDEIVPFDGGAWFFSAGSSRRYGLEVGAQCDFRCGIGWKSAFTGLIARYRNYSNDLGDFGGKEVPGIPSLVFNNRLRYQSPHGILVELTAEYTSQYPVDDANHFRVSSSLIFNSMVGYTLQIESFYLSVFGGIQNLMDRKYASSAFINPTTRSSSGTLIAPSYLEPGLPRNLFFGVDAKVQL